MAPQIHDYLGTFVDPESGTSLLPEGFDQGFEGAYTAENSVAQAAVQVANERVAVLEDELLRLKAQLFDQNMTNAPAENIADAEEANTEPNEDDVKDIDELGTFEHED